MGTSIASGKKILTIIECVQDFNLRTVNFNMILGRAVFKALEENMMMTCLLLKEQNVGRYQANKVE